MSEILAGDVRQLVGFIEDHYFSLRDKFAKPALFNHHIRKKKVVVYNHHIRVHRLFTRFHHKALFVERAIAAKAVVVGTGDQRPGLGILRHADAGADIAILRLI